MQEVLRSYDQMHARIPAMLQDEAAQQLRLFDANKIFSEIGGFEQKAFDDEQVRRKPIQPACTCARAAAPPRSETAHVGCRRG